MTDNIHVRPMTNKDLPQVAQVHSRAFSGFFLDSMGQPFLRGYYGIVLRYEESIALVAENTEGEVIGFVVGFLNPPAFYSFVKQQWYRLVPGACYAVLRRPYLLSKIFLRNRRVRTRSKPSASETTIELASIGTASRENGVGSELMSKFIEATTNTRGTKIALTTDLHNNSPVQNFYRKHGFLETGVDRQDDREMLSYMRHV